MILVKRNFNATKNDRLNHFKTSQHGDNKIQHELEQQTQL